MKTLPTRMLRHAAALLIPESVTAWHALDASRTVRLTSVHVQREAAMDTSDGYAANMEPRPRAELWYDCRLSHPHGLDWTRLQLEAEAAGDYLRIAAADGRIYRVSRVDELPDDRGGVHHYRMELI